MIPVNLPPTYFRQSTSVEVRQSVRPLERADQMHEPVLPPYHVTGVQLTPIVGISPYKPEGLEWLPINDYLPRPIPNLTYLYPSSNFPF
jgi:hypothetical protein